MRGRLTDLRPQAAIPTSQVFRSLGWHYRTELLPVSGNSIFLRSFLGKFLPLCKRKSCKLSILVNPDPGQWIMQIPQVRLIWSKAFRGWKRSSHISAHDVARRSLNKSLPDCAQSGRGTAKYRRQQSTVFCDYSSRSYAGPVNCWPPESFGSPDF